MILLSRAFLASLILALALLVPVAAQAQARPQPVDYPLGAGDVIRIQVFQNPDLSVEARVSESGFISYPLLGGIRVGGLSPNQAEQLIATRLREGSFLQNPQVTLNVVEFRSQQVSVLGYVNKPGRFPLETTGMRLSEVLAMAGGIGAGGSDVAIVMTQRNGKPERIAVDVAQMFLFNQPGQDIPIRSGDTVYVHRAPIYYASGQVQRPGSYPLERGMTVAQAIAKSGGLTLRGTERGLRLQRRDMNGVMLTFEPKLEEPVQPDDLIFVRESLF